MGRASRGTAPAGSGSRASSGLRGVSHRIVPDRIEAGHVPLRRGATGGDVVLRHARADHLQAVADKLREAGATDRSGRGLGARACRRPAARGELPDQRVPGLPDRHAGAADGAHCIAEGAATITETIFDNRFMHVNELLRLGAHIDVDGRIAVVQGVARLSGASVMATDLRASAGLVIAGLVADGETLVDRIYHLDRGYDRMEAKLLGLGAAIERVS
jgi:UDP-N-acetylglucosamine 1-carboxyvinyltransferase